MMKQVTIYGLEIDEGMCLNRLNNILKAIESSGEKFPNLLYGAIELRYAIEGTVKQHALMLSGKPLKNFIGKKKIMHLKNVLKEHDEQFFIKLHVCVMISKYGLGEDVMEPNFDVLDEIYGKISIFLHAPHKFGSMEDFDEWIQKFETCLIEGSKYMFELFGPYKPKKRMLKHILNEKGRWLVDQYDSGKMNEDTIVKYLKSHYRKTCS